MSRRLVTRIVALVIAVVAATFLSFVMLRWSRDPVDVVAVIRGVDLSQPGARAALGHELGTDRPLVVQYGSWLAGVVHGDLGVSWVDGGRVSTKLARALPVNLELAVLAEAVALFLAVPVGLLAASRQGRATDSLISTVALGLVSLPGFAMAIFLVVVFSTWLGWLPATASGFRPLFSDPVANIRSLVLPALSLGLGLGGIYTRVLRVDMGATLREDFVTFARAKGIRRSRILTHHALRPSSATLVTVVGLQLGSLIGGSLFVEALFAFPNGLGQELTKAAIARDAPVLLGAVALSTTAFVTSNLVADSLGRLLDPRGARD